MPKDILSKGQKKKGGGGVRRTAPPPPQRVKVLMAASFRNYPLELNGRRNLFEINFFLNGRPFTLAKSWKSPLKRCRKYLSSHRKLYPNLLTKNCPLRSMRNAREISLIAKYIAFFEFGYKYWFMSCVFVFFFFIHV